MEWLAIWGVAQATWSVFHPILNHLATDVADDIAKSYVGRCFERVYSGLHKKPLARATGLAVKELLELIDNELIRADLDDEQRREFVDDVAAFLEHDDVRQAIASLFVDPQYKLDPKTFATAWQQSAVAHTLPDGFSWQFVAKRFADKVAAIRISTAELRDTFQALAGAGDSEALREIAGLPPDFDLEAYREALVERYGTLDLASLDTTGPYYNDVRLWSVFVPQSARECHEYDPQLLEVPKEHLERLAAAGELDAEQLAESEKLHDERRRAYVSQPPRPVLDVVGGTGILPVTQTGQHGQDARATQRLVILGDPGSGKSSLLRFLALRWAMIDDANLRYTQPLPLLVELRDYNRWECPSGKGFPKYLHEAPTWHRLNQQTLDHLLKQPDRVVLLLDGLDEVFDPVERERVVNDIHRFSNDYKHVRIVVTSRTVGYQPHRLRSADFRHFMLQDLDADQIGHFLDRWHEVTFDKPEEGQAKRQRLAAAIKNSKSIAQLAGNPLLLTMMAILNRNQKLPDDRVDLYQQCSRLLLHQWDVERTLGEFPGLSAEIGLREKTDILRTVAYAMQTRLSDESRANYIDGTTLTSLIEDYLHTELRFDQARAVARALVEQLRTRNFILCYLGADSYAFVHRTFLEYFCAADIVHQFNVAKTLSEQDLIALFDAHCRDDDWREVLRLICGQIDEQFVGRIVEHLATRTDLEKWDGVDPMPEFPLAIESLSEVRNIGRLEEPGSTLLSRVIQVFTRASGKEDSGPTVTNEFFKRLIDATQSIGSRWPGTNELRQRAVAWAKSNNTWGTHYWSQFVAEVLNDPETLGELIKLSHLNFLPLFAIHELADRWPTQFTRTRLLDCVNDSENGSLRAAALRALAEKWPDETTRELLAQRAVQDEDESPRSAALEALAEKWPDETTRQLLAQRAVQDDNQSPRRAALQALAEKWPDETTRELLAQRAVQDDHEYARRAALHALAEKWPNETTLALLESQVASFKERWRRTEIEKTIKSLRAKLRANEPRSGSTT